MGCLVRDYALGLPRESAASCNLNTHSLASLYETSEPTEARRLVKKLKTVHTPVHGSWLNMAEVELSALERQALGNRVPTVLAPVRRVKTWNDRRNNQSVDIDWQFTTADARIKLWRLYPQIRS